MKKLNFLLILLLSISNLAAQNYYMATPQGFGRNTTGGGSPTSSNTVIVTTYKGLTDALKSTTKSVILVSGTIECNYTSVQLNDKTIIGLPGARLVNLQTAENLNPKTNPDRKDLSGILTIKPGSNNIIIRNLIFEGPGSFDADARDNITNEGTNVWVDHCEFQDGHDGNFDNKGNADNITISWCKFTYKKTATPGGFGGSDAHNFSNLIGSDKNGAPTDGHYSITFQNCYWAEGCIERMPRARNAELHILNCYYNSSLGKLAIGLGGGVNNTTCYVEGTNFAQIKNVYQNYSSDGGTISVAFDDCIGNSSIPSNVGTVSKPNYAYSVIPAADVEAALTNECGAGATLQVTPTGDISSSCQTLGLNNNKQNVSFNYYPTLVDSVLNIDFMSADSGKAIIDIYTLNGNKVYTQVKNIESDQKLTLILSSLSKGMYLCKVNLNNKTESFKFLKN